MPSVAKTRRIKKHAAQLRRATASPGVNYPSFSAKLSQHPTSAVQTTVKKVDPLLTEDIFKLLDFGLPHGFAYALAGVGISTIGVLLERTENDLLEEKGFGPFRVNKIKGVLAVLGKRLKAETN